MPFPWRPGQALTADRLNSMGWSIAQQESEQTVTSSTTPIDSQIVIPVEASARYLFRTRVSYGSSSAGGIRINWTGPSGAAMGRYIQAVASTAYDADDARMVTRVRAMGTEQTAGGGLTFALYQEDGDVQVGGTAGDMTLQFAQASSDATGTILRTGTLVYYRRIA